MATSEKSNEHIAHFLDAYLADENAPPFAVLIKGPWGIGKTHFVKEALKASPHLTDQHQWTYVSLNGFRRAPVFTACAVYSTVYRACSLALDLEERK